MKIEQLMDQYKEIILFLAKDGDRGNFLIRPDLSYKELSDVKSNMYWCDFRYVLQRLEGRDYPKIATLKKPNFHSFETAFVYGLETLFDYLIPILYDSDADKKKNLDYYIIFFKIAQVGAKMINREIGYNAHLSYENIIVDKEDFVAELSFIYLFKLFSQVYTQRNVKWIYQTLSNAINKLELVIIKQKITENNIRRMASMEITLSLSKSIVSKIERDIQLYGRSNTFTKKWAFNEFINYRPTVNNESEIFVDIFSTGDINDTKTFILKYLSYKASNSNHKWIKSLLDRTPKNSADEKARYKYHSFLSAFFNECKANGVIESTVTPTQFCKYLDKVYSNKLTSLKAFYSKQNPQQKEFFEDLKMWLKKYHPGKQRN